ncbi:MAG: lipid A biosynthesis acyltransferase [Gammaproteobacteria bacterium]|jgi:KDO2-lipid IV(A) lauroyltransferase|nr:lipid A biosynthesis acyltransferase [Gammaproteobacteria bacterium]
MTRLLAIALLRLLSWTPLRVLDALAVPLSWILRLLPWRGHAVIRKNLEMCFPELDAGERETRYRQHLVESMRLVLESGAMSYWSADTLQRHVPIVEGWEATRELIDGKRGVIIVGAHFGNWEVLPLWLSIHRPLTALYKAPKRPELDRLITTTRSRFGSRMIASGSPSMRRMLAALKQGEMIGILADQQPKQGEGVFIDFFGQPALTMTLVNRLARRTGAAVIFISAERLPKGKGWNLRFTPADERIADENPASALAVMHEWLEDEVRRNPAQYLWSYKRFSLQPGGRPSPYPRNSRRNKRAS